MTENENIDEQIKAAMADAQKTGNWTTYNKLCVEKTNKEMMFPRGKQ
jgi:hypothetical protein